MVCEGLWQVNLTLEFTRDYLIMQLLLLCIILLNQNQDLVLTAIMAIPMLLKIHLTLFREEGQGICVNSMNFFWFAGERPWRHV